MQSIGEVLQALRVVLIDTGLRWYDVMLVITPVIATLLGGMATYYASYKIELKKMKLQDKSVAI